MKKLVILIIFVGVTLGTSLISKQEADTELPKYTPEQRWNRASFSVTLSFVTGIAYAKSKGQSAEEYGEYCAKLYTPSWGEPNSGTLNVIRGMNLNYMAWTESEFEITESSDEFVTGRSNRPYVKYFGDDKSLYGVTVEEFEKCFSVFNNRLADYLGLKYKDEVKDGWLYMTFSKIK
jgi:hypothetical protein